MSFIPLIVASSLLISCIPLVPKPTTKLNNYNLDLYHDPILNDEEMLGRCLDQSNDKYVTSSLYIYEDPYSFVYSSWGDVLVYNTEDNINETRITNRSEYNKLGADCSISFDNKFLLSSSPSNNSVHLYEYPYVNDSAHLYNDSYVKYELIKAHDAILSELHLLHFGQSISMDARGRYAIIGGPGDNSGIGAAWLYSRISNSKLTKLKPSSVIAGEQFGSSVHMNGAGTLFVISSPEYNKTVGSNPNDSVGRLYIYSVMNLKLLQIIERYDLFKFTSNPQQFGSNARFDYTGDTLITGSTDKNSLYVLKKKHGKWKLKTTLSSNDYSAIGLNFDISGNGKVIVSCTNRYDNDDDTVCIVYQLLDQRFIQTQVLSVSTEDETITNVDLNMDGTVLIVSSYLYNSLQGRVWKYVVN